MQSDEYKDPLATSGCSLRLGVGEVDSALPYPSGRIAIRTCLAALLASCFLSPNPVQAADWAQYAGPSGDGSSPESVRTNWSQVPPRVLWRQPIGPGFSSIVTGGGKLFTQSKQSTNIIDRELCLALDAQTGLEQWRVDIGLAQYTDLAGYDKHVDGPRSTPSIDGEFVYVVNSRLKLYCLRAATGVEVWSRDFKAELGSQLIQWENAASPLLIGDLILLNINAGTKKLIAVQKSNGATVWRAEDVGMTHATPVVARIGDVLQVVFLTSKGLVAVVPETGSVLWRVAFSPSGISTAASPVVSGDFIHASATYGSGTWLARVSKSDSGFSAATLTGFPRRGTDYQCHWSTPVMQGGDIYAIPGPSSDQAKLVCFDPVAGTNRWTQSIVGSGKIGFGSVIGAANVLIVMTENGELALVHPDSAGYKPIGKFKVLKQLCWNRSTLANGRIYARNSALLSEIVAVDVAPPLPPLPPFSIEADRLPNGDLHLEVRSQDETPLETGHGQQLELVSSTDLTKPLTDWTVATVAWTLRDGRLQADLSLLDTPVNFIRVREIAR